MAKRARLEIIRDILTIIKDNRGKVKPTPLLRKSNLSSSRFKEYFNDLKNRRLAIEVSTNSGKQISITEKGLRFLEKYRTIVDFIEEFEL